MILPSTVFLFDLCVYRILPGVTLGLGWGMGLPFPLIVLSKHPDLWLPLFMGREIPFYAKEPSRPELIVWNVTILICICTFQVLWPIFAVLWILLTPLMLVCWLGVGLVIHETHGMCVGSVRIFWVGIWTGTNTNAHINTPKPAGRYGSFVPKETVEIVKPVVAVEQPKLSI